MRLFIPLRLATTLFGFTLLVAAQPCRAQAAGVNQGGAGYIHAPAGSQTMPQKSADTLSPQDRMREAERRRHILDDTAKVVQLATELKAAVDQAPADQLSLDITRKAAALEKLAHDLKQWSTF